MRSYLSRTTAIIGMGLLWLAALIEIYPIILVVFSAVKSKPELAVNPFGFPKEITFQFFATAYDTMHYFRSVSNTVLIACVSVVLSAAMTSMAAYAIVRRKNRFHSFLYMLFLAGMIIPFQMTMIPLYKMMVDLGLYNSYHGIMMIYLALTAPFSVFLLVGFIKSVPRELEEAALIDGCGIFQTFFRIVLPLLKPALTTLCVLNLFSVWNDFLMPVLFLPDDKKMTITVQISKFQGMYSNDWSLLFAGICMIVLPMVVIYLLAQRFIINGITAGAIKG
ncbi:raffinose/stachyose/melibiose transport system permease protein [Paenibacillus catalpae]|uniref:Raffinose/stachyose/melibiose transport system permease protein n=1 Tax=Paenibacillus catalpae TaxID=1045775 RepID=A0A1I2AGC5_9BACL|nr:carbohydrate ABC transporter permease [Paenibacillus catalpae]SFE41880.1 raffinose/stachyose/melibiose transport system permease protein [Paenibacillus catalpae]